MCFCRLSFETNRTFSPALQTVEGIPRSSLMTSIMIHSNIISDDEIYKGASRSGTQPSVVLPLHPIKTGWYLHSMKGDEGFVRLGTPCTDSHFRSTVQSPNEDMLFCLPFRSDQP